jgi:demethylmenaquinone methyltransferase/2-methoxy-6-polyprenyl-1,4-benzoquinol methylase
MAGRSAMYRVLGESGVAGDVLEIACGTGWWTQRLAQRAGRLTAVDASPEMIEINRQRVADPRVQYLVANIFDWSPAQRYDVVFFGFWLTHVPPARFEDFWRLCEQALRPSGRVGWAIEVRQLSTRFLYGRGGRSSGRGETNVDS